MPSIDTRVVEMKFDNAKFERGIKTSTDSLGRLKESLNFDKQSASLKQFENYANNVNFGALQNGIEAIKNRFSTLGIVGAEVVRTLTNQAMYLGSRIVSSVAGPLSNVTYLMKEGGKQRALNVEQAKFIMEGLKLDFNKFNDDINNAVNGTRFGYDEAAMAASQLAASGVSAAKKLDKSGKKISYMGEALLAISGAAAMTNTEYSDMANIFTTVASNGRLMTEQVRSFSYRGLNITADLAKQFGKTEAQMADMISKGKVDFKMFSEAMYNLYGKQATKADEMLTGVTANIRAAWKKIGQDFWTPIVANNSPIVKGLQKFKDLVNNTIRPAVRSLFEVDGKEFLEDNAWMRLVNNIGKAMQKVFSSTYTLEFVDKSIRSMGGSIRKIVDGINDIVTSEHSANIFKNIIDGLSSSFESLRAFVQPFKDIFHDVFDNMFPKINLENLDTFTGNFKKFTDNLKIFTGVKYGRGDLTEVGNDMDVTFTSFYRFFRLWEALLNIFKNAATSIATIFKIIKDAVSAFFKALHIDVDSLISVVEHFSEFTDSIAKFIKRFWAFESASHIFEKVFQSIADFLAPVFHFIVDHVNGILDVLGKLTSWGADQIGGFIRMFNEAFFEAPTEAASGKSPIDKFIEWLLGGLNKIREGFEFIMTELAPTIERIKTRITVAMSRIAAAFKLDKLGASLKSGALIGGIMILQQLFKKYRFKIGQMLANIGNPIKKITQSVTNAFSSISSMLSAQVKSINVERVKTLAEAILIIAGAMFVLSLIPVDQLGVAVAAVTSALVELGAMMKYINKLADSGDDINGAFNFTTKATGLAIEMIGIAAALLIISFAMKNLAKLDPEELARGIFGIGLLLTELGAFMRMVKFDKDTKIPAASLILLSVAVLILARALKNIGSMDNEGAARGIIGLGAIFTALILFTKYANNAKGLGKTAFALILLSTAVLMISGAVKSMSKLDNEGLARGLFGMYNIMLAMILFTRFVKTPKGFMKTVTAMILLSVAVKILASAVKGMGALDNESLARGILGIYALMGAMLLFSKYAKDSKGLFGASIAMVILSAAMTSFARVIGTLGAMDNESLARGLFGLGVALLELGIAMHYMSKDKMSVGTIAGLLLMSIFVNALALALKQMSLIDPEGMALALIGLGVALGEIVIAMNMMSSDAIFGGLTSLGKGAAFIMMGVGINILATALGKLAAIDPERMALALFGLGTSLAMMAAMSLIAAGPLLALGTAVALFGGGVGALAWGLAKLGAVLIPFVAVIVAAGPEIIQFLKDLVIGFAEVLPVLVRGVVNAVGEFFVALVEKADEIADAVGELILTVLRKLKEIIPELIEVIAEIVAEIWKYLGPALGKLFPWLLEKLAAGWNWIKANFFPLLGGLLDWVWGIIFGFFSKILQGIVGFVSLILNGISWLKENFFTLLGGFLDWAWGLIMSFFGWILQGVINFVSAVNGFFSGLFDFIWGIITDMWDAGVEFVSNLISGINEKITDATEAIGQLIQDMVDGVTGFWQDFYDAGANLVQGIIDGVGSLWDTAVGSLKSLGKSMWEKFTGFWQEASPSKRSKWGAEMIVRGIVKGIDDYSYLASRSVRNMSEGMWDSMDFVGSAVSDALDANVNPTITPVLDLSNIQNGASAINGLFGSRTFSLASSNEAALEKQRLAALNKLETTSTNADVVAALGLLRGDVNNLNDSFLGTQVVLDSGALVGATARQMDNALGRIKIYKGRGI